MKLTNSLTESFLKIPFFKRLSKILKKYFQKIME